MRSLELPGWQSRLSAAAALLLAVLFLSSGIWKIVYITELRMPPQLSLAVALGFAIAETLGGVLILVPRFRRWGAILAGGLILAFAVYFAVNYGALHGLECNCFPGIRRAVDPALFVEDGFLLALALAAGRWARPSSDARSASVILGAVVVFALVSFGVATERQKERLKELPPPVTRTAVQPAQ